MFHLGCKDTVAQIAVQMKDMWHETRAFWEEVITGKHKALSHSAERISMPTNAMETAIKNQ